MHVNNMHQVTTPALCLALLACQVVRDSVMERGPTSLVMLRDSSRTWKIVHDHSS